MKAVNSKCKLDFNQTGSTNELKMIGKESDAGRHWGQKEKGTTEDEMAGWHHCLNGRESE